MLIEDLEDVPFDLPPSSEFPAKIAAVMGYVAKNGEYESFEAAKNSPAPIATPIQRAATPHFHADLAPQPRGGGECHLLLPD